MTTQSQKEHQERRTFLKMSGLGTAGAILGAATLNAPRVHAAENNTINVALVGCGGRGGGAIHQAMATEGPTRVVALTDAFEPRVRALARALRETFPDGVDPNMQEIAGLDGYKVAIDAVGPGGAVILATAPAFRPMQLEYAVEKGVHVFMEKSFAVDAPGVRRILRAGEVAQRKNLKIVGGLMSRHYVPLQQAVEQLHNGIIGERITCWAYRMHAGVHFGPRMEGETAVAHQVRNWWAFNWAGGSFIVDWLIHQLDVCCWAKGAFPVSAQGMGGRQSRVAQDEMFDYFAVEYTFADGTRLHAQGRHQHGTWGSFQATIHGETGCAVIGEMVTHPRIFRGHNPSAESMIWEYPGDVRTHDQYQAGQTLLFDAIRNDRPINETERCAHSTMVGILGRMAAETGQWLTWEQAMNSTFEYVPNLESLTLNCPAPVQPDENGNFPIPVPGVTPFA